MNESDELRVREALDEAIRSWASQYGQHMLSRLKDDDTIGYRLRAELIVRILRVLRSESSTPNR